jgi:transposase
MSDARIWIGLDLGLRRTRISVVDAIGAELLNEECDTKLSALKNALAAFPLEQIGLIAAEAGNDVHIVRKLRQNGFPVAIFEARQASKFLAIRRNKTDAGDARGLADLARLGRHSVSQVYLKSPECQQLRGTLVMRRRLVMMRVAADASLRSRLGSHGLVLPAARAPGQMRLHVQDALAQLCWDERRDLKSDLAPLVELCESLRAYLKKLDADLDKIARSHAACRLLMEVPGVGPICAISFYTAIEDPSRFKSPTQVGAYLGLTPRRHQSGATSRSLGITKSGNKLTRTSLVTAATVFGNTAPDCALKRWYLALRDRAGPGRARVALARKLAVILLTMWKNESHFEMHGASGQPTGGAVGEGYDRQSDEVAPPH